MQFNNFCTQQPNCILEGLNCGPIAGLLMDSIISRNGPWRIELCDDVCGGECGTSSFGESGSNRLDRADGAVADEFSSIQPPIFAVE